jgi:ribonucleoside-triphosphate reductase
VSFNIEINHNTSLNVLTILCFHYCEVRGIHQKGRKMQPENDNGVIAREILSSITFFLKYAKYLPELQRRENWVEACDRNMNMHLRKFPYLEKEIREVYQLVREKKVLPSMRSVQFAGKAAEINNVRIYNCSYMPMDHYLAFPELMFLLLAGTGVGYSVQRDHVDCLPEIKKPTKSRRYLIDDSIVGWADAVKALVKAFFFGKSLPDFDFSDIRPKGAPLKTSGGKAPGPEPLKNCLHHIQMIFERKENGDKLTPLEVHDINCFIADAVLSGGIRRSSMIALFDMDDEDMLAAKTGDWLSLYPFRQNANNSAVILRHRVEKEDFLALWKRIELSGSGEPGFFFTNDKDWGLNPCAEISLRPFQFCNLVTINGGSVETQEELNERARAAAFIATLQASYTNFHYLRDVWKRTTEREALIGVSITGIATGSVLRLDLKQAANIVKEENERVAAMIGINKAARTTTVKPEGTSSLFLGTSSGIHAWHAPFYLRSIRIMKNESLYTYLSIYHPEILEDDAFKPKTMAVVRIPQKSPEGAITREEPASALLSRVSHVWKDWVKTGHRSGSNKNNVSTTVSIRPDEWDSVGEWMWENRNNFTALSAFPYDDSVYHQAPFEDITEEEYNKRVQTLHDINLDMVVEINDDTKLAQEVACGGGACEVV